MTNLVFLLCGHVTPNLFDWKALAVLVLVHEQFLGKPPELVG